MTRPSWLPALALCAAGCAHIGNVDGPIEGVQSIASDGAGGFVVCADYAHTVDSKTTPAPVRVSVDTGGHQTGQADGGCTLPTPTGRPLSLNLADGTTVQPVFAGPDEWDLTATDASGQKRWSTKLAYQSVESLFSDGSALYVGVSAPVLLKLSPADGSTLWKAALHR